MSGIEPSSAAPLFVDTHCHLDLAQFDGIRDQVLAESVAAGVRSWINIGFSPERWPTTLDLVEKHRGMAHVLGVHPQDASAWNHDCGKRLEELIVATGARALGETGLDYAYDTATRQQQASAFRAQLALARGLSLPAVIHMRDAEEDVVAILRSEPALPRLVFHSFDGSQDLLDFALTHDAVIGVGGLATRQRNEALRAVIRTAPLDRILLETDSPYLVPARTRGRVNTPASIAVIARFVAEWFVTTPEDVARRTTRLANEVFGPLPVAPAGADT